MLQVFYRDLRTDHKVIIKKCAPVS